MSEQIERSLSRLSDHVEAERRDVDEFFAGRLMEFGRVQEFLNRARDFSAAYQRLAEFAVDRQAALSLEKAIAGFLAAEIRARGGKASALKAVG